MNYWHTHTCLIFRVNLCEKCQFQRATYHMPLFREHSSDAIRELIRGCHKVTEGVRQERSGCGCNREAWGMLAVIRMSCNLTGISVNILVLIVDYGFARCYLWRKLAKGYTESFCIISSNCLRIYNYLKIKILMKEMTFLSLKMILTHSEGSVWLVNYPLLWSFYILLHFIYF